MIPNTMQGILWSKDIKRLDETADKTYIIHQLLAFGDTKDISWLLRTYPKKEIIQVFAKHPQKIYSKAAFHFTKNILLGIKSELDEKKIHHVFI